MKNDEVKIHMNAVAIGNMLVKEQGDVVGLYGPWRVEWNVDKQGIVQGCDIYLSPSARR